MAAIRHEQWHHLAAMQRGSPPLRLNAPIVPTDASDVKPITSHTAEHGEHGSPLPQPDREERERKRPTWGGGESGVFFVVWELLD